VLKSKIMAIHSIEITTENLLGMVLQMPKKEFDHFLKDAQRLKNREVELIKKLKRLDLSPEKQKVYRSLLKKFRAENIASEEYRTLLQISEELEKIGVERLKFLIEISKIRNKTLDEIMEELNIKPKSYE
jgi:hypothetical protein